MGMSTRAILRLEDAGFSREQVEALAEFADDSGATKADVADLRGEINLLRWMVGVCVALEVAILLKLLF